MTREEFIRNAIENRKESKALCCNVNCTNCPYEGVTCGANVIYDLLDRIIELEQKPKGEDTNLAWYFCGYEEKDGMLGIWLENEALKYTKDTEMEDILDWLLSEYQKPYKISKFEYDFLECLKGQKADQRIYYILNSMREKGYFKNVPKDMPIAEILSKAEVI